LRPLSVGTGRPKKEKARTLSESSAPSSPADLLMMEMHATLRRQNEALLEAKSAPSYIGGRSPVDGDPALGRGSKEREEFFAAMNRAPKKWHDAWWATCRGEVGALSDEPLNLRSYGERTLQEHWKGHATLHRFWLMLSHLHATLLAEGKDHTLAAISQLAKSLARATRQKGQWAGAWEFTPLPDIGESGGGVTMDEDAMIGRTLQSKAAIAKAPKEAKD